VVQQIYISRGTDDYTLYIDNDINFFVFFDKNRNLRV